MGRRKRYLQSRLDYYLKSSVQEIIPSECGKRFYKEINCSLLSEINVSDNYSYFRCNYRKGIEYPKTGFCFSCPLKNLEGIWIGVDIDMKDRKEYLQSQIDPQWICFGIK
ncbi:MAG TPA: hypothetical protein PLI06_09265 [Methanofastidiosum sp.]|nr:hypothetical protein [Methanofastidiosum sp.]HNU60971.1 hypothetical protein [Methanofastidiosum sp.]HOI77781.1 hypothetical protein [Methanofastidiosum sp.]